eukprot:475504_1
MPKQFPNKTPSELIKDRQKKLLKHNAFPTVNDTTITIGQLADKFHEKSMVPQNWFIASLTCLISYTLTGSRLHINAEHLIGACLWFLIIGISSTRKGACSSFFAKQLDRLQPILKLFIGDSFVAYLDGGTISGITEQVKTNEGTLGILYEEIGEFRKQFKIDDNDGLRSKLLSIYDGRPWRYKYKTLVNIDMERTYFIMLLNGQYETATDFLNTFKKEGFAPRIQPVYTPGVIPISSKDQKKAAKIWKERKYDDKIHITIKQLLFRFGANHLCDPKNTFFDHRIAEEAEDYHDHISDLCTGKLANLEFEDSDVASAYGKLPDRVAAVALSWTAFEEQWKLCEDDIKLNKPLRLYSEEEKKDLDPRLVNQGVILRKNILETAFSFCEKNMLVDLGIRENYFPYNIKQEDKSIQSISVSPSLSWVGKYLMKCSIPIISVRYLISVAQIRLGVFKPSKAAKVEHIKELNKYLSNLNIGQNVIDDSYLLLYDINNITDLKAVKEILLGYQFLGMGKKDIKQLFSCKNIKNLCFNQYNDVISKSMKGTWYKAKTDEWKSNYLEQKKKDFDDNLWKLIQ